MQPPLYDFDAMRLDIGRARAALQNPPMLRGAFIWEKTPQGAEYWEQQSSGLDVVGRSTLAFMIAQSIVMEIHASFVGRAA